MSNDRYDRQIRLFGSHGQKQISEAHVAVLGAGGLAAPLIQQLAYLGVVEFTFADSDIVTATSLNRVVGAGPADIGKHKVAVAERAVRAIQPSAKVNALPFDVPDDAVTAAVASSTVVVGCFDRETPRLVATNMCSAAGVPYIDLATEVVATPGGAVFGGRIVVAGDGTGCVSCLDVLDAGELARERMTDEQRRVDDAVYGVDRDELEGSGPSVVTLNSVVASLAATEIMCLLTGLRPVSRQLAYRGDLGTVGRPREIGRDGCPYCVRWRKAAQARHGGVG